MPLKKSDVVFALAEFGLFDKFSGGATQLQHTDYIPAGQKEPIKLAGTSMTSDITISRAFDPTLDSPLKDWLNKYKQGLETTRAGILRYYNAQGKIFKTDIYPRCVPKEYTPPDGANGDNAVAEVKFVLGVEAVA
jgi:hypothetical protein